MNTHERIWAFEPDIFDNMSVWQDSPSPAGDTVEYIRADLVDPLSDPRVKALVKALDACMTSLERADTTEGVCCCGDSMDQHSDPMWCGHSPVDMGTYYAANAIEAARAALRAIEENGE
jgi:hypothetical protein